VLNQDYKDILSALLNKKVDFLLVGAYALAVHGLPRATGDIDLWIKRDETNVKNLLHALTLFGAPLSQITEKDFLTKGIVYQIGVAPRRIDILTSIDGVEFDEAWPRRVEVKIDGLKIPVISREHLLKNKKSTGRLQDAADASRLIETEE
jgi:hypothetical protein